MPFRISKPNSSASALLEQASKPNSSAPSKIWSTTGILVALAIVFANPFACSRKCPACPPPAPPKVVEVTKPCMEPIPKSLSLLALTTSIPDPWMVDDRITYEISGKDMLSLSLIFSGLLGYLNTSLELCGKK